MGLESRRLEWERRVSAINLFEGGLGAYWEASLENRPCFQNSWCHGQRDTVFGAMKVTGLNPYTQKGIFQGRLTIQPWSANSP